MKHLLRAVTIALALCAVVSNSLADSHEIPATKASAALERMKQLVGTWKGTGSDMGDGSVEVNYRVSSGGTVLIETLFPGTPNEMTTTYYDEDGKLSMTHYCMLANHPVMNVTRDSDSVLTFETVPGNKLHDQPHMNSLEITFASKDSIEHRWSSVHAGKDAKLTVFKLHRES